MLALGRYSSLRFSRLWIPEHWTRRSGPSGSHSFLCRISGGFNEEVVQPSHLEKRVGELQPGQWVFHHRFLCLLSTPDLLLPGWLSQDPLQ
ncbi:uncharacterized protein LOC128594832 isoform X3 [Nycticebus coucang]|uniref:uncharacterized protein LOC128594832 isoform X3 n=1 Tax=Nycticebus coucang TaxID=9470 RepID=UPI00234CC054|nr:uncharacterized protein LOC128594832 isoform X3 [Nycticebus coucang]